MSRSVSNEKPLRLSETLPRLGENLWRVGLNPFAFGLESFAFGLESFAFGRESSAFRLESSAFRLESFAFRLESFAFRLESFAFRLESSAFRLESSAFGRGCLAVQHLANSFSRSGTPATALRTMRRIKAHLRFCVATASASRSVASAAVMTLRPEEFMRAVGKEPTHVAAVCLLAVVGGMVACDESKAPAPASLAPPEAIPASVAIPASEVELGAAIRTIRKTVELPAFRITRFPVTVGDYRQCVVDGR